MMELSSEVGIVSCFVVQPWMKQVKRDVLPIFEALLQPRDFLLQPLFGTILWPFFYFGEAHCLRIHRRVQGRTFLSYLPHLLLFYTTERLVPYPDLIPLFLGRRPFLGSTSREYFLLLPLFGTIE